MFITTSRWHTNQIIENCMEIWIKWKGTPDDATPIKPKPYITTPAFQTRSDFTQKNISNQSSMQLIANYFTDASTFRWNQNETNTQRTRGVGIVRYFISFGVSKLSVFVLLKKQFL